MSASRLNHLLWVAYLLRMCGKLAVYCSLCCSICTHVHTHIIYCNTNTCVLYQSSQVCVAAAVNQTLCVWRVKDGQLVSLRLPELITALEWKKNQKEGESPTLLLGLVSGQLLLAALLRASINLTPEIHTTYLEQVFTGADCTYFTYAAFPTPYTSFVSSCVCPS